MTRDVIWWPPAEEEETARVAVVTVSYNTKDLTALLLWSLYRVLEWGALDVVVVDNSSRDGSAELLAQAQDAGLCDLIANNANLFHGPALNQALSLARWSPNSDGPVGLGARLGFASLLARTRFPRRLRSSRAGMPRSSANPAGTPGTSARRSGFTRFCCVPLGCGDRRSRPSPPVAIRSTKRSSLPGQPGM